MRKLDQKQYAASAADAKTPSEGNQMNSNEAINVIHVPYESTPVKVAYEFLAMNAPYKEMERRAFPAYIQKIADLLTYLSGREKAGASHCPESQREKRNFPYPFGDKECWRKNNGDYQGRRL